MRKEIKLLIEGFFNDEIFNLKDDINQDILDIGDKFYSYLFFPKTKDELIKLLKQLLEERGPNAYLNDIDTSEITDMSYLFLELEPHNIDISEWDVSNVTDMSYMFWDRMNFNCNLSRWDVRNVVNMRSLFNSCIKFTGNGLENWDVSNVKYMDWMFQNCINFDCNLFNWKLKKAKYINGMFYNCIKFTGQGLENWDVSNVEKKKNVFVNCPLLKNKPIWYH